MRRSPSTATQSRLRKQQRSVEIKVVTTLAHLNETRTSLLEPLRARLHCHRLRGRAYSWCVACDLQVRSDVPVGAGLSSSAALTVATWRVLAKAFSWTARATTTRTPGPARRDTKSSGHRAGLMDQLAVHCGNPGELIPIMCRPDPIGPPLPVPPLGGASGRWTAACGTPFRATRPTGRRGQRASWGCRYLRRDHGVQGSYLTEMGATGPRHEEKRAKQSVSRGAAERDDTGRNSLRTLRRIRRRT